MLKFESSDPEFLNTEEGGGGAGSLQPSNWGQLTSFDLNNGVRIMLPNFCLTDWDDHVPNHRTGEIPIFISLLKQPDQDATVELTVETLQAKLSTNILHFTSKDWDQPQIVWANPNDSESGEAISNLEIAASLQIGGPSAKTKTEIFSISLPESNELAIGSCAQESDNTSQPNSERPNIDLELSTVREEESPAFLLLRTALLPLILLSKMAMHSIHQIKSNHTNKPNEPQSDNQPSNESSSTTTLPKESNRIDVSFEGIELIPQSIDPNSSSENIPTLSMTPSISSLSGPLPDSTVDLW